MERARGETAAENRWHRGAMGRARDVLRRVYGHVDFRPEQRSVVAAMLQGRDLLAVLPTGAGKSVCFQVPALLARALTVVVSPLVALMDDQVTGLRRRGIHAVAAIHGGMSGRHRREALREAAAGGLRLLYVAPERLGSPRLREALVRRELGPIVVDEAHCISERASGGAERVLRGRCHLRCHLVPRVRSVSVLGSRPSRPNGNQLKGGDVTRGENRAPGACRDPPVG